MPDAATSLVKGSNRKLDIRKYQQKDFFRGNRLFNFSTPSVCTIHHLDLPAELQLMTLSKLDLENLHNSKLVLKEHTYPVFCLLNSFDSARSTKPNLLHPSTPTTAGNKTSK